MFRLPTFFLTSGGGVSPTTSISTRVCPEPPQKCFFRADTQSRKDFDTVQYMIRIIVHTQTAATRRRYYYLNTSHPANAVNVYLYHAQKKLFFVMFVQEVNWVVDFCCCGWERMHDMLTYCGAHTLRCGH